MLTFGSLSEEGRSNGIQGDAIRNIQGHFGTLYTYDLSDSIFFNYNTSGGAPKIGGGSGPLDPYQCNLDISRALPTAGENRTKNRKIRIYKRIA